MKNNITGKLTAIFALIGAAVVVMGSSKTATAVEAIGWQHILM